MRINRNAAFDAAIAIGLLASSIIAVTIDFDDFSGRTDLRSRDAAFWILQAMTTLPLAARRIRPTPVVLVTGLTLTAMSVAGYETSISAFGVLIAMYSVAAYASRTDALISAAVGVVAIAVSILSQLSGVESVVGLFGNYALFGTAWLFGDSVRGRRERISELEDAAARVAKERVDADVRAARGERNRIARELHDIVAHSLSVMVIHAGAVRRDLAQSNDDRQHRVRTIEETGRATLNEMRQLLGSLRSDSGEASPLTPQPGIDDLAQLVGDFSNAGLRINFVSDRDAEVNLSQSVATSAYRVIQESLTNCLRHAGDANVELILRVRADAIDISISDDGRGAAADPTDHGYGLIGIRERIELFGGTVHAGPRVGGGWSVRASLPSTTPVSR